MRLLKLVILCLFLVACTGTGTKTDLQQFIGGTQGVVASYETNTPPKEAFDGGYAPFDVVVRLENKGEQDIKPGDTTVRITGILEPEFNLRAGDLTKKVQEDLSPVRQDATKKTIPGNPVFVEFKNFNHVSPIAGSALDFPLRADVCYVYATQASTLLCSRANILNPDAGGVCEITGDKAVANSGAPVQVQNVKEAARTSTSVTFSFDIKHVGTGYLFEQNSICDKSQRKYEDEVNVDVETKVPGLSCSRLDTAGEGRVKGFIKMFGGTTTVTCTQNFVSSVDAVVPVTINVGYDYEERAQTTVTVRHAGDN